MKALLLVFLAVVVSAKPPALLKTKENIPGRYIVKLKAGHSTDLAINMIETLGNPKIFHRYNTVFPGFAAELTDQMIELLLASDAVEYVEEDGVVHADAVSSWGLDRIDQISLPLDDEFQPIGDGSGVNVYVFDTGINFDHEDFEGRAHPFFDALRDGGRDCVGHGSHSAGIVAGLQYGVAKAAHVYSVRVLTCFAIGDWSNFIAACDYVTANAEGLSIASMSLGARATVSADDAVRSMIASGITVVASAGNDDSYACNNSPANVLEAITVGATNSSDARYTLSNYGECVDIFAPGVDITSAYNGRSDATNVLTGTSTACPHVSGAAAVLLSDDPTLTPADIKEALQLKSIVDVITGIQAGSPNLLVYIGVGSGGGYIPAPYDDGCGGNFTTESPGSFATQHYPNNYNDDMVCDYLVTTPGNSIVIVEFTDFELEISGTCLFDTLSIYDGPDTSGTLTGIYCGNDNPGTVVSSGNSMFFRFQSETSRTFRGFHAIYYGAETNECGHTFTAFYGVLTSTNFPEKYGNNENCGSLISGQANMTVTLTFTDFDIEEHTECDYDMLQIFDGDDDTAPTLGIYCGTELPSPVTSSSGNGLYVKFTSDASVTRGGFRAESIVQ